MLIILKYSYLLLPICYLLLRTRFKNQILTLFAAYGLICFAYIIYWDDIPRSLKKHVQLGYTLLEYLFFSYLIWSNIVRKGFKKFIVVASALFFLFLVFYAILSPYQRLDSVPIGIETILVFIYIFYFFYEYTKTVKESLISDHFCFWISVGVLIYLGGSFFFFISFNHLRDASSIEVFGNITFITEIIKNILFIISMIIYTKNLKKVQSKIRKLPNLDMI